MEKKAYLNRLREELELQLRKECPGVTVEIKFCYSRLVVIFPTERKFLHYTDLDSIAEAGQIIWINYKEDHFEVEVRPFCSEKTMKTFPASEKRRLF